MKEKVELVDFSECKFIRYEMRYYTYFDFCENCLSIRRLFNSLSINGKTFYMYYVYANTRMDLKCKNAIWDFLNFDTIETYNTLMDIRRKKMHKKEEESGRTN